MKKLITALCVLAVGVSAFAAGNLVAKTRSDKVKGDDVVGNGVLSKNFSINSFVPSNVIDYGFHGSAFSRWDSRKIAFSPETNLLSTVYDRKDASGAKATGAAAADGWGASYEGSTINPHGDFYAALPDVVSCDKYAVAFLADNSKTSESFFISVYDKDEETWSDKICVKTATDVMPSKVRVAHGDMTKDNNGNYYLMMTAVYENAAYGDRKGCVIVGKTTDPFNGPWVFSDYNDMKFLVAGTAPVNEVVTDFHGAWGKNGFGIAMAIGQNSADSLRFYYSYTKNYGQDWQSLGNDPANAGYKKMNYTRKPIEMMLPCVGDSLLGETDATVFDGSWIRKDFSLAVDDMNDVHVLTKGSATSGTQYLPLAYYSENLVPVNGYWLFTKKFGDDGVPESEAVNEGWEVSHVAHYSGGVLDPKIGEATVEGEYTNVNQMSLSYVGNGCLIASWMDRPRVNAITTETFGEQTGVTQDKYYTFVCNPYVVASYNYGKTWEYFVAPESDSLGVENPKRAFEIQTYSDNKTFELGFALANRGTSTIVDGKVKAEAYAVYGIPQLTAVSPVEVFPAGSTGPGSAHHKWEQNFYMMKIGMDQETGINTKAVALNKNFEMAQNYPNPFNPTTAIEFNLKNEASVNLAVYNANGQMVSELINSKMNSGLHTANFNASSLNSGVYFYKLTVDGQSAVKKMVLTK